LHLPSTGGQIVLIPLYLIAAKLIFGKKISLNSKGLPMILFSVGLIFVITFLVNKSCNPVWDVWSHPRYLAHSVRELATFPVTYYPIPLYFVFRTLNSDKAQQPLDAATNKLASVFALIFAVGIGYSGFRSLSVRSGGVGAKNRVSPKGGESGHFVYLSVSLL
jgi:membrane protease YdiL (CAAX protease family)